MINESLNQTIFTHGINIEKALLEWNDATVTAAVTINAGGCVRLDSTTGPATLVPVTTDVKVLGLAKSNKNIYVDEVGGALGGIYGSGKMGVIIKGIVTLMSNYYQDPVTGVINEFKTFDGTSFTKGAAVYASATSIINTTGASGTTNCKVGSVLDYNSTTKTLQILVDC